MANKDKLLESAQKFLAKGQVARAIGEYQQLIDAFPRDYRNRQKLAELLCRERRFDEALAHFEAVARNFAEMGFYLKAIAIYKQMQKIDPSRADTYLRVAELNEQHGLIGNALSEYHHLMAFYDRHGMLREAAAVLQKMSCLEPDNGGLRSRLIETLAAAGEEASAREQLRALLRVLDNKRDHAGIIKLYTKFPDLAMPDVPSHLPLARALLASGQVDEALSLLDSLCLQEPAQPELLLTLCAAQFAAGTLAEARLTCQQLLAAFPEDVDLCERCLRTCLAGADYRYALDQLATASALFFQTGRGEVVKELAMALQQHLPSDSRLQDLLNACQAVPAATGSGEGPAESSELPPIVLRLIDDGVTETTPSAVVPDLPAAHVFELELEFDLNGLDELAIPACGDEAPPIVQHSASAVDALDLGLVLPATAAAAAADAPGETDAMCCAAEDDDYQSADYEALEELADDDEFAELEIIAEELALPGEEVPIGNDIFAAPTADMTTAVSAAPDEDAQSHFDLGIAYKEMGMFAEAINEFASAARDPSRLLDCLILKGQCLVQWGELVAAEAAFKEALANPSLTDAVRIALRYELGLLYESSARPLEALESFEFVAGRDQFFRDVADKQKDLRRLLGLDEETLPPAGEHPGRDRISYL